MAKKRRRRGKSSFNIGGLIIPIILLLGMGFLGFLLMPSLDHNSEHDFDDTFIVKNQLVPDRQIVSIRVDSLLLLTEQLSVSYRNLFEVTVDKEFSIMNTGKAILFNEVFLDRKDLSGFEVLSNNPISITTGYGFNVPIKTKESISYVDLPVEIVQSMLFHSK